MNYDSLFTPFSIGKCEIKNRIVMSAMGTLMSNRDGTFSEDEIAYFEARAKGGTGMIIIGQGYLTADLGQGVLGHYWDHYHIVPSARALTNRCKAYGCKVFTQLSCGTGRNANELHGKPPYSSSENTWVWDPKVKCHALTLEEIREIMKQWEYSAGLVRDAGFDGIEVHAHIGYLIDQFAISLFNQRTDEYGGSLENRLRFAREIVEEIKRRCGQDFPVMLRYSPKSFIKALREGALPGEEFEEKGRDLPEGVEAAKLLVSYGYDALDVDVGSYDAWWWSHPPMYQKKGLYMPYAKLVKENVDVPVLCAGRMDDPDMA